MLRDILASLPGSGTWPCDEINYSWRHHNLRIPTDEFKTVHATPRICRYVHGAFERLARRLNLDHVVEKTCANSLRVGFVKRVCPDARFVFIVRDGRDAAASAMGRWTSPLNVRYIAAKTRFVPPADLPYYAGRYALNRLHRILSPAGTLATWGPKFDGMQEVLRTKGLPAVCAHQWMRCVERAEEDFRTVESSRVYRVRYEDFVREPVEELTKMLQFLGKNLSLAEIQSRVRGVRAGSVGKWRTELREADADCIETITSSTLHSLGYDAPGPI
jgi:hypothetical protein